MKYCPKCGKDNTDCTLGVLNSDYMYCHDCKSRLNIFEDEEEYVPIEADVYDHTPVE